MTSAPDRNAERPTRPVRMWLAARRYLVRGLLLLLAGLLVAAAIQIGFNVLRYMIQPDWLAGRRFRLIVALAGLLAALVVALFLRRLCTRPPLWPGEQVIMLMLAVVADPYFLAWLGWRSAPEMAGLLAIGRVAALSWVLMPRPRSRRESRFDVPVLVLVLIASVLPPRFWLVPKLPGDLETAAMAPIHLLVFAKTAIFMLIGAALARALRAGETDRAAHLP